MRRIVLLAVLLLASPAAAQRLSPQGGTVVGTGTLNRLMKWESASKAGNSSITDDGVLVSTATAFRAGEIESLVASGAAGFVIGTSAKSWTLYPVGDDLLLHEYTTTQGAGGGNMRVTYKAGGNVGIGDLTPDNALTANGAISATTGVFVDEARTTGISKQGTKLSFRTNTTDDRVVIEQDGDMCVNATSCTGKLTVSGGTTLLRGTNTNAASTSNLAALELHTGRDSTHLLNAGQTTGDIAIQYGGQGGGYRHWISSKHGTAGSTNALRFWVNDSATAGASSAPGTGNVNALNLNGDGTVEIPGGFASTPTGINSYDQTSYEWADEWLQRLIVASQTAGSIYYAAVSGGGFQSDRSGGGRPGIVQMVTNAGSTNSVHITTNYNAFDLGSHAESIYEWVGGFPSLSTATDEYWAMVGFFDASTVDQTDGCFAYYDRGGAMAGNPLGTGDKWGFGCASNGTRTLIVLDGLLGTVDSPITALAWPNTGVDRIKITVTPTAATIHIDGTLRGTITTNIPSGQTRLCGAGFGFRKVAGTTNRHMETDYTRLRYTMNALRSP